MPVPKFAAGLYESAHEFKPSVQRKVGVLILVAAILAMLFSNLFYDQYSHLLESSSVIPSWTWAKFVDKGIMSIFFFAAGMEIRHEFFHGHLTKPELRKLPLYCAIGGVFGPLILMGMFGTIFTLFGASNSSDIFRGSPIPIATDIVFALAFLSFFSNKVPRSLRAFVLAFAVIDDLIGLCMLFVLQGTISPTAIAVVLGFLIPSNIGTYQIRSHFLANLLIVNSFIVLPIFALANAGISFKGFSPKDLASEPLFWSIVISQFIGKIAGIFGVAMFAFKSPKLLVPAGCNKQHLLLAASVAAIGFTLSLYLAKAAFSEDEATLLIAKSAVVIATLISVVFATYTARKLPSK